jgi:hypothetical protein
MRGRLFGTTPDSLAGPMPGSSTSALEFFPLPVQNIGNVVYQTRFPKTGVAHV